MLQIFLGIFNQKRGTLLDKADKPNYPLNLTNERTCFWLKLIQLLCLGRKWNSTAYNVRSKIRSLRKAGKTRKGQWLIKRAKNEFKVSPFKAGKNLLHPKRYCSLKVDQETLDQHKSSNLIENNYDIPLGNLQGLPPEPLLVKKFNISCFSFDDFFEILSLRRNASAPGLNGIPYKVYQKCPKISKFIFKIFQTCFKRCEIPIQWRSAPEIYIPKVSCPSENKLSDFRPIALLNVEGKLFFSLISKCLKAHVIHNNKFIDNSIRNGCMEKIPGCWEHLSMVWKRQEPKSLI